MSLPHEYKGGIEIFDSIAGDTPEDFWKVNRYAQGEYEPERGRSSNTDTVGGQIDGTCERINRSVNNSGTFRTRELSPGTQEMILIGSILLAKFCLWWLYRTAQRNDVDVAGL